MTGHRLVITGAADRTLDFAVERLRDGSFYDPGKGSWHRPRARAAYARLEQGGAGLYSAALPELDPGQDYCVHVFDAGAQQLVVSQLIDGAGRRITLPRAGARKGRPAPRNEYHGGFAVDIRAGRQVELE